MIRVRSHYQGYTIVETIIFMAITGVLFISVMVLIGGQQSKTQFSTSTKDIDSKIQDVINDVATGYYSNPNTFTCSTPPPGRPVISIPSGSPNQGQNQDCIFVGRILQFGEAGTSRKGYDLFTMVGRRQTATQKEVTSLYEAQVIPVERGTSTNPVPVSATDKSTLNNGLNVQKMYYVDTSTGTRQNIGAVGFFSTFASYSSGGGGGVISGAAVTNLLPIKSSTLDMSVPDMVDAIYGYLNPGPPTGNPAELNPASGVIICFESGSTDQYGVLTIGSNGRQLNTKVEIMDTATALAGKCS